MVSFNSQLLFLTAVAIVSALPQGTTTAPATLPTLPGTCVGEWAQCTSEEYPTAGWIFPACCEGTICVFEDSLWSQCLAS
ncbi:hypothetical protein B0H11DRAFT_2262078 [Mycena galericulata]|nr:hypothetical protein B0H11DRAFT_2262078 [Mycena galericulata]